MPVLRSALATHVLLAVVVAAPRSFAQTIYWTDVGSSKIQRLDLIDGVGVEDLLTAGQVFTPVDIALDRAAGKMYWTESTLADFMIQRANLDGTGIELLVTALVSPHGIALDLQARKMYWTDIGTGKIQRANLDGSGVEDLLTAGAVFRPDDIALDAADHRMYWTDSTPTDAMIRRADLDGSHVELLVSGLVRPDGIAVDLARGKMYWADPGAGKIQRANLDGSAVEDLVTTGLIEPVQIALDAPGGKIYWTEASPADFMISRANLDGSDPEFLVEGLASPRGIALDLWTDGPGGACCFGFGFCAWQSQAQCESVPGQLYLGDGVECLGDVTCPIVCRNCRCVDGFRARSTSDIGCVAEENACADLCQTHGGVASFDCALGACDAIPAVSEWGLIAMVLAMLTAGAVMVRRRAADTTTRFRWGT